MIAVIRTIVLVVISVVATIFVIQNLATIEVAFLTWSFAAPRAVIFVLLLGAGLVLGYLSHALRPKPRSQRSQHRQSAVREVKPTAQADPDKPPG